MAVLIKHLLLLCSLVAAGALESTVSRILYVKPSDNSSHCPEPCYTLNEYVQNSTSYFLSNTSFHFLPGTHQLNHSLTVQNVSDFAFFAISGTVNISCYTRSCISFQMITNMTIKGLGFVYSPLTLTNIVNMTIEGLCFVYSPLSLTNIVNLSFIDVTMKGVITTGMGEARQLEAINILGASTFTRVETIPDQATAEIQIYYFDVENASLFNLTRNKLVIENFVHNPLPSETFASISVILRHSNYNVDLIFREFEAFYNAAIYIDSQEKTSALNNITMFKLDMYSVQLVFYGTSNTLFFILNSSFSLTDIKFYLTSTLITIEDSLFLDGELSISALHSNSMNLVKNVTFNNSGSLTLDNVQQFTFLDCTFNNSGPLILNNVQQFSFLDCAFVNSQASIKLYKSSNTNFTNCVFNKNSETPIVSITSTFILSGSNNFTNNVSYQRGAMALYGFSYVSFAKRSTTLFLNNSAQIAGGAIYVDNSNEINDQCFFKFPTECLTAVRDHLSCSIKLAFGNNTATTGGDILFGASLDTCKVADRYDGWTFAGTFFHNNNNKTNDSDISVVTSDPRRPCLYDDRGKPLCTTFNKSVSHYPGETFQLNVFLVGDRFGTVDGIVYGHILPGEEVTELGQSEQTQFVSHLNCTQIHYTVFSNASRVILALTPNSSTVHHYPSKSQIKSFDEAAWLYTYDDLGKITEPLSSMPLYINVTLLPCPLGFVLSGEPPGCICDHLLMTNNISCNITTQTVQRTGTQWVNASFKNGQSNGVIVYKYCPNGYCRQQKVDVNLTDPDTQCSFNHSGTLCGGCQPGLSLALGSGQCLPCSNHNLALLIAFALAGFVLVLFIKVLNLTVAVGTFNGLLFYANIVSANQSAWIPRGDSNILTVFIAWLNLDLNIETCFIHGLDAYWKTWLQFVFPLYVWAIVVAIIFLSHYFSFATKLFGNNSVPVLATLFLISYSKLLRTVISIFNFSILKYPDGTSEAVWSYDGNIPYFHPERVPLLIMAFAVLVILCLPYTGILLFAQCIQRSNYRFATLLVNKLKPFFDAYSGPLKDKHRYWVGTLLLARGTLFVVYAATPTSMTNIDLLATQVTVLAFWLYPDTGNMYRSVYINLLENSFFFNLGLLTVGTLYIRVAGGNQAALAYASIGIAFVQFLGIVLFHSLQTLNRHFKLLRRLPCAETNNVVQRAQRDYEHLQEDRQVNRTRRDVTQLRAPFNDYREPLLKYLDDYNS